MLSGHNVLTLLILSGHLANMTGRTYLRTCHSTCSMIMTETFQQQQDNRCECIVEQACTAKKMNTHKLVKAETPYLDSVYYSQVGVIRDVVNMISNHSAAAVTQAPGHAYRPHVVLLGHYSNMYRN